jgi:type IV pilus assembly protein PilA
MIMKRILTKKNGEKGFTLVEVIVVLVILAILAAIAIPALTGYIDKAKSKTYISIAREEKMAIQTMLSEQYAVLGSYPVLGSNKNDAAAIRYTGNTATYNSTLGYFYYVSPINYNGKTYYALCVVDPASAWTTTPGVVCKEFTSLCDNPAALPRSSLSSAGGYRSDFVISATGQLEGLICPVADKNSTTCVFVSYNMNPNDFIMDGSGWKVWTSTDGIAFAPY